MKRTGRSRGWIRRNVGAATLGGVVALASMVVPLVTGAVSASSTLSLGAKSASAATVPMCTTGQLVIWFDTQGSGAAGSIYYDLQFTNLSSTPCTLKGYPGVSAVNLAGHQIGNAAQRNTTAIPSAIMLSHGATAMAIVQFTDTGNYPPSSCRPGTAAGLRVYPPGQRASKIVPYPFLACNRSGENYLHVETVERRH